MKAICKTKADIGLTLMDVPNPQFGPHDVLIQIEKTAICGTDTSIYQWSSWAQKNVPIPLVIGHEFMGRVKDIGSQVTHVKVGDRVSGEGHLTCGECRNCLEGKRYLCPNTKGVGYHKNGCFAEYLSLPEKNVFILPSDISDEMGALLDPFGNATFTALSCDLVGEDILITGAGPIGCMAVAIAKHAGARSITITDPNQGRLEEAKKMGATHLINITKETLPENSRFKVGLEMSGHPDGLNTLLKHTTMGGEIALLGILPPSTQIDWDLVIFKCLTLRGIWGRKIFGTWHKMIGLLQGGLDISSLITHRFKAHEFQKGFDVMLSGKALKVILDWT
ncbi:L-threonine 3-dehydrogenase [Chlamydiales bacterium]|nr:L-threonine 3-dehydrogenase [Chlamydiales bacterium]